MWTTLELAAKRTGRSARELLAAGAAGNPPWLLTVVAGGWAATPTPFPLRALEMNQLEGHLELMPNSAWALIEAGELEVRHVIQGGRTYKLSAPRKVTIAEVWIEDENLGLADPSPELLASALLGDRRNAGQVAASSSLKTPHESAKQAANRQARQLLLLAVFAQMYARVYTEYRRDCKDDRVNKLGAKEGWGKVIVDTTQQVSRNGLAEHVMYELGGAKQTTFPSLGKTSIDGALRSAGVSDDQRANLVALLEKDLEEAENALRLASDGKSAT